MYLLFSWFLCSLLHRLAVRISLPFHDYLSLTLNRPHPSSKNPHFQNETRCTTFPVKMNFICMRMKNHFHIKGWTPTLVLKQRRGELGNGLLNLFQEIESVIHWSDGYTMLIGLSPWTCWYSIFWWSLIRYKDAHGSRDRCLPHYPPQYLRVCAEQLWGRDCCLPTPGWYGFAHALETGQAMGWCTCVNSCYVCYNATRYFLTFSSNWMVPSK